MVFFLLLAINLSLLSSENNLLSIARISLSTFACLSLFAFLILFRSIIFFIYLLEMIAAIIIITIIAPIKPCSLYVPHAAYKRALPKINRIIYSIYYIILHFVVCEVIGNLSNSNPSICLNTSKAYPVFKLILCCISNEGIEPSSFHL